MIPTFRYCGISFQPTAVEGGFLLRSEDSPRVLFVSEKGVHECARDGSNAPLELFDCGALTLLKVQALLGDEAAGAAVKKLEVARRAQMLEDAAKAAVDAALKAIAAADAKDEAKP